MRLYQGAMVNGDTIETDPAYEGWVWIEWLYPGMNKVRAIKDVRAIEGRIKERKLRGWLASSERDHTTMHKILAKMGATKYQESDDALYFMKEVI